MSEPLLRERVGCVVDACGCEHELRRKTGTKMALLLGDVGGWVILQKKRPFHILRSSRFVNSRPEVRYFSRLWRAFSRVGRSGKLKHELVTFFIAV